MPPLSSCTCGSSDALELAIATVPRVDSKQLEWEMGLICPHILNIYHRAQHGEHSITVSKRTMNRGVGFTGWVPQKTDSEMQVGGSVGLPLAPTPVS